MKLLSVCLFGVLTTAPVLASSGNELLIEKLNERITQLENRKLTQTPDRLVTVPWDIVDKREQRLWTSVLNSYDFLRSFFITERYNYIYNGVKATTLGHPQRIEALKNWIKKEDQHLASKKLSPKFYQKWNQHVSEIKAAIDDIAKSRPEVRSVVAGNDLQNEQYQFLKQIKENLIEIEQEAKVEAATQSFTRPILKDEETGTFLPEVVNNNLLLFSGLASLLGLGFVFIRPKKKKRIKVRRAVPKVTELPPLPLEATRAMEEMEAIEDTTQAPSYPAISLEEECHKVLEQNNHLLKTAEINVYPVNRSPFKTDVHAPKEKVTEALNWLLKGTIAIANTSGAKVSHLEWNCRENDGRVSVDLILHGLECDYKALYLNALVEGDGSAPAHFGRTEMALDGHLPSVMFKKGSKKTTISLGVDSRGHSISH